MFGFEYVIEQLFGVFFALLLIMAIAIVIFGICMIVVGFVRVIKQNHKDRS